MFSDVEVKMKKRNKLLFSRDSLCLQELKQLIQLQNHRTLVMWAFDCAKFPLDQFEAKYPDERRPRTCLERCEEWARGEIKMPIAKRAILDSHAVAKEMDDIEYGTLCQAIGHAGATVHVETHALGLPIYELTSIVNKYGKAHFHGPVSEKINYYYTRLQYWQETTDKLELSWAGFLLDDTKPNKERLWNEKR
ncbi:MAG: putative immunity protein [Halobacillus sp.]|uniref:putative immunity protein n=1 Tax=Halobacillus sp. TaxID=56800 RepID=UPI003BAFFDDA